MPIISNSAAQTYVINLKGKRKRTVAGVMSCELVDILYFDGTNYRDEIDATFMGAPRSLIADETDGVSPTDVLIPNGSAANVIGSSNVQLGFAAINDPHFEESDSFTHTEPRHEEKQTTYLRLWSATAGSGNLLYEVERILVEDWGIAETGEPTIIS